MSYVVFIYLVLDIYQDFYLRQVIREADRFSASVIRATRYSMLNNDPEATKSIVKNLSTQEEISDIRIYNHDGVTKFSGQPLEVGTKVDKKAEACFACHSEDKPFNEVVTDARTRIHYHTGHRVLGMITPIYNEQSCYAASCHAHPIDHKVLGVLDVGVSLKKLDSGASSLVKQIILLGVGTCVAVFFTIALYIFFRVHRPVNRLKTASKKIAAGDFSYKVPVDSTDELGEFARGFNGMGEQIQKRAQELVQSRWQYKNLFEQVPCFICVIDQNLKIVQQNSSMRELFKGAVGMHCYEAFKKQNEKCKDCHAESTLSRGTMSHKEHCGLTFAGEEASYVSYTAPITDENGKILYAMIIAVDVEDRVKLQKELEITKEFQENLIENSIHGIVATDKDGRLAIFNRAAETLLGYKDEEVLGDTDLEKYFPKPFLETILDAYLGKPIDNHRIIAQETVIPSSKGEQVPVRFSGVILFEKDQAIGSVGFYQDLRMFKQLEREKRASDRLAVVGQTVAGLAHGIKNILQGLEGGVYVVQTGIEDGDQPLLQRGWKMVEKNIGHISGLVKDLLSYSKERPPEYEAADPNALAEEACALFDMRAAEKSIVIERDFDPNVGKTVQVFLDQRGIHTCLCNLIANAIDACAIDDKKEEHRIVVRTKEDDEGNPVYEVSDNGIGMDADTRRKVFAGFFSTKGSRGTGLGLLVTSKIVMEHHGDISFESKPGVGSTFTLRLPNRRAFEAYESTDSSANAERTDVFDTDSIIDEDQEELAAPAGTEG